MKKKSFDPHATIEPGETREEARNEDPLSGAAGAHPVGTGVGAALGGAAAGAAAGALGGPVGAVVGAVAGGVAGGYAGKAVAENIDPTVETEYWRGEYSQRPYYDEAYTYDDYEPAYRAGWSAYDPDAPADWSEREGLAREHWESETATADHPLTWEEARAASRDAYTRVCKKYPK